ncbi:hypothetical protein [Sphingomonas baiyangensis]|uniref:hypothetical protein n=1 Tax=Sphingomonas baiyangensis TaxID=2572576 RepID=UPI001BAF1D76|nr:hypothetical protein [Sphingomonas baiyangensis]
MKVTRGGALALLAFASWGLPPLLSRFHGLDGDSDSFSGGASGSHAPDKIR